VVAVRIGWVRPEANLPQTFAPAGPGSADVAIHRDYCHLRSAVSSRAGGTLVVVNGMSANTGMRWDIEYTAACWATKPKDDVTRPG